MDFGLVFSFLSASVILTLMPGPDNIFVLTESLTKGHKTGIAISLGLSSGILVHTSAAATGLSIIIQNSDTAFSILKYFGAAYLFYLSFMAVREQRLKIDFQKKEETDNKSFLKLFRRGFLMNVLNPKVSLFFIAFLPQFISKKGFNTTCQMFILGIIFMIQAILIFSSISVLSSRLTASLNSPKFWNITKWSKVAVLSLLGLVLVFAER